MNNLKYGIQTSKLSILLNAILFTAFFTFYFVFFLDLIPNSIGLTNDSSLIQICFISAIAITLATSSLLKLDLFKTRLIYITPIMTVLLTSLLLFVSHYLIVLIITVFVGIFFSLSQLSFFIHFWHSTAATERGRIGGIIGLITLPAYFIISTITASSQNFIEITIIAIGLSLMPVIAYYLRPKKRQPILNKEENYPEKRTILLYSLPWLIFSLINMTLAKNIAVSTQSEMAPSIVMSFAATQTIAALIGTLFGGVISDFFGRRITLALSVTLYGTSMALAGLIHNPEISHFVFFADGLSWGILLTLYSFVIWGDLSNKKNCASMYSIGLIIFYVAGGIGQLFNEIIPAPIFVIALIACTLIFFSNAPIALAPELLSTEFREKMRLKKHIKKAKEIAKQYENQG